MFRCRLFSVCDYTCRTSVRLFLFQYKLERSAVISKFNFKNTNKTVNRDSFPAYKMQDKEQLVTAVLTTMFGDRRTARRDVEPNLRGRDRLLL